MEPNPLKEALDEYARARGRDVFTLSAHKYMVENVPANWVISPFSAECFLTIIRLGAKGQTAEEIKEKLRHLSCDDVTTALALARVILNLRTRTGHILKLATKIYVSRNYEMKAYFNCLVRGCHAEIENVDFTQQCASAMNDFLLRSMTDELHKKITDDMLLAATKMVLVNGVSFKANWQTPFRKTSTQMQFFVNKWESIMVESMARLCPHAYYHSDILQAKILDIDLTTKNYRDCSLMLVIPDEVDGLARIEADIEFAFMVPILPHPEKTTIELELPIFKIETLMDFKEIFNRAGIQKVFDEDEADLTGISDTKGLYLNHFLQQTVFSLNENGVNGDKEQFHFECPPTETDIHNAFTASKDSPPLCLKADRPFVFYIRVRNVVVNTGRFVNPSP